MSYCRESNLNDTIKGWLFSQSSSQSAYCVICFMYLTLNNLIYSCSIWPDSAASFVLTKWNVTLCAHNKQYVLRLLRCINTTLLQISFPLLSILCSMYVPVKIEFRSNVMIGCVYHKSYLMWQLYYKNPENTQLNVCRMNKLV